MDGQRRFSAGRGVVTRAAATALLLQGLLTLHGQTSVAAAMARQQERLPAVSSTGTSPEPAVPPTSLEGALRDLFQRADIIFAGEVLSIDRERDAVVVRWQVEDAVRGTAAGAVYALHEWSGLWQANGARYTVGQRALLLLHAPSAAGYASPVGGSDGVVPLRGSLPDGVLDLRLLAQRVVVTDAARLRPMQALQRAGGSSALGIPLQAGAESTNGTSAGTPAAVPADGNSGVDGAMLLGMLHAWERERAAAR